MPKMSRNRPGPLGLGFKFAAPIEPPLPYPDGEYGVLCVDGQAFRAAEMRIEGNLGNGNFGYVYRAVHKQLNIAAAVKKIPDKNREEARKRMLMDLEINKKADSDFVVKFYGFDFVQGELHIYMEEMRCSWDGVYQTVQARRDARLAAIHQHTLALQPALQHGDEAAAAEMQALQQQEVAVLHEFVIPEAALQAVAYSITQGLLYLKEVLGVLHQDIKPSNVLLGYDGRVKLCDFGVCSKTHGSYVNTILGCKMYFAPEKLNIFEGEIDSRTDVWSMGLTLLELALLKFPLPPLPPMELLAFVQRREALPQVPEGYSEDFRDFVAKCLRYDVAERPKIYASPTAFPEEQPLRMHPFVSAPGMAPPDLASWFEEIVTADHAVPAAAAAAAAAHMVEGAVGEAAGMEGAMDPEAFLMQQQQQQFLQQQQQLLAFQQQFVQQQQQQQQGDGASGGADSYIFLN